MTSLWLDRAETATTDAFVPDAAFDEVIVGAGFTGLLTALLLARAGRSVAVVEARRFGAVTSGNTTAKLSVLQGARLQQIRSHSGSRVLEAYVEANREGFSWLVRYCEEHGIPLQRRDSISYSTSAKSASTIDTEFRVAREAGLPVRRTSSIGLPFPVSAAVVLPDQAQFDPLDVMSALVADIRFHGGRVIEGTRVVGVSSAKHPAVVLTDRGGISAERVIIATGSPILDRGLYWAKLTPSRSYAVAFRVTEPIPSSMYLGIDSPTRSLRTTPADTDAGELLIVGGNGHGVGRHPSPLSCVDDIEEWTKRYWPSARRTHAWSAQDYRTANRVPFVGWMPRGNGRVYLATGYDKWGMTNSVQCALTLAADLLGGSIGWADVLHHRISRPSAIASAIGANAAVAAWYVRGYAKALTRGVPERAPEGSGEVGRNGFRLAATSTVDGIGCTLSAHCSHMGAIVSWNDFERSWDCPAHGSRFSPSGEVLEGPATRNLRKHNVSREEYSQ